MKNNYDIIQPVQSYSIHREDYAVKYGSEKDITSAEIKTQIGTIISLEDVGEDAWDNYSNGTGGKSFYGFRYRYHILSHHKILSSYQPGASGINYSVSEEEQTEIERQIEEDEDYIADNTTQKSLLYIAYSNEYYTESTNVFVKKKGSYLVIDGMPKGNRRAIVINGRALSNQVPCDIKLSIKEEKDETQDNIKIESSVDTVQTNPDLIKGKEAEKMYAAEKACSDEVLSAKIQVNFDLKVAPAEDTAMYFKRILNKKGHIFHESGDYKLNMIGIRSNNRLTNAFDDVMHLLYKVNGSWIHKIYKITTDPGRDYLVGSKTKSFGAAILVPGQYRYRIGKHKETYVALNPIDGCDVYRDKNKDEIYDFDKTTISPKKNYAINIHRSNPNRKSTEVNDWSAGCQVFADPKEWNEFIEICTTSRKKDKKNENVFLYTLLMKSDLKIR